MEDAGYRHNVAKYCVLLNGNFYDCHMNHCTRIIEERMWLVL